MARKIAPSPVRLYLFGSFHAEGEKGPIDLSARKAQALLAYLVLYPGEHLRETLAALFWGDSSDVQARDSFRTVLKSLRKQFGDKLVLADRETAQLNPEFPLWVDVREFQVYDQRDTNATVGLYRGDLLPGFYDEWILQERDRLRVLYINALARLAQVYHERGDYERAVQYAKQVLVADETNEEAFRQLMLSYAASGNRNGALKLYEECARILRAELDVEPSPETTAIYLEIKSAVIQPEVPAPRRTNVPVPLNSFVGRTRETEHVKALIASQRLVTLTGAGGSGKTRLAIKVAAELVDKFAAGVWWVELAALTEAALVPQAIAKVLDIREVPNQEMVETLVNQLRGKQILLVLDNCEHLIDAAAKVAEKMLLAALDLKILATSREAVDLPGESVYLVPTLSLPTTLDLPLHQVLEHEATRLFIERASAVNSQLALTAQNALAIVQICRRLDGIPLAIELAAARAKLLTPEHINARLNDRFNLLTHGSRSALPRQQTLRATIDWSYDLLPGDAKKLFRRLSVFVDGFTLDAAEVVCSDEQLAATAMLEELARLVDRSLVLVEQRTERERYRLLETIREYAREADAAQETATLKSRHMEYFVMLAEEAELQLFGPEQAMWFERLELERGNLRAATEWSLDGDRAEAGLRLMTALWYFWFSHGPLSETYARTVELLGRPSAAGRTAIRARALNSLGHSNWAGLIKSDLSPHLEQALAIGTELGDKAIIATSLRQLGLAAHLEGDLEGAQPFLEQSLRVERGVSFQERHLDSQSLLFLGDVVLHQGNAAQARTYYQQGLDLLGWIQDKNFLAYGIRRLGQVAADEGDLESAEAHCKKSLLFNLEVGDRRGLIACIAAIAGIAHSRGQPLKAAQLFGAAHVVLVMDDLRLLQIDELRYERNLALLQAQLDKAAFAEAWAEGQDMTLEQAIEYALDRIEQKSTN